MGAAGIKKRGGEPWLLWGGACSGPVNNQLIAHPRPWATSSASTKSSRQQSVVVRHSLRHSMEVRSHNIVGATGDLDDGDHVARRIGRARVDRRWLVSIPSRDG